MKRDVRITSSEFERRILTYDDGKKRTIDLRVGRDKIHTVVDPQYVGIPSDVDKRNGRNDSCFYTFRIGIRVVDYGGESKPNNPQFPFFFYWDFASLWRISRLKEGLRKIDNVPRLRT